MAKPVVAQKGPFDVALKATYRYAWCACGLSGHQPFCDGSHTRAPGFAPVVFTAEKEKTVYFCGCKHTGTPPYCDGTHNKLS